MKKTLSIILVICVLLSFTVFALGSGSDDDAESQGSGSVVVDTNNNPAETKDDSITEPVATQPTEDKTTLGDYQVEIKSCRLAEDFESEPVVIVLYSFTNVKNNTAQAFAYAIEDAVYHDGVGLNKAYILKDSANYSADNQTKEIKKDASIEVEVADELNDTTTDIEVEVKELFSLSDKSLTKTFTLQ